MTDRSFYLTVCGNRYVAARAAADRGIGFAFVRQDKEGGMLVTGGRAGIEHRDAIAQWRADSTAKPPRRGDLVTVTEPRGEA